MKDKEKQRIVQTRTCASWYSRNSDHVNAEKRLARKKIAERKAREKRERQSK